MDRFIPNRSAMDMDYARSVMTQRPLPLQQQHPSNPYYQALLAAALGKNPASRILAFGNHRNPQNPLHLCSTLQTPSRQFPPKPALVLDAPGLLCDDSLSAIDWGHNNVIAVALSETLYGYNFNSKESFEIASVDDEEEERLITGVNWNPDGHRIAVGLSSGEVQVWDVSAQRKVDTFLGGCGRGHVGSLAWNDSDNLTIATGDGKIVDWNLGSNKIVASYRGHRGKVLGLKWSPASARSRWLASSGMDMVVNVWDRTKPSSQFRKFMEHRASVRGLDWSPVRSDLLVSGGLDCSIKFWSTNSDKCLRSVNTGSEVLSLLWTNFRCELLSSHGSPGNHVSLWRYPSMEITGKSEHHFSRLQYMARSPDDSKMASALGASAPGAEDEKLVVWNFHDRPQVEKYAAREKNFDFFSNFSSIRLEMVEVYSPQHLRGSAVTRVGIIGPSMEVALQEIDFLSSEGQLLWLL